MNEALFSPLGQAPSFQNLIKCLKASEVTALYGLPEGIRPYLAAAVHHQTGRPVVLLLGSDLNAARAAEDISQLLGGQAAYLPSREIQFARGAASHENTWRRLETLQRLVKGEIKVLCLSVESMMHRLVDKQVFAYAMLELAPGDIMKPHDLIEHLIRGGYERVEMVEGKGQCAMRGAIVDIYPPASTNALRIEFFDDEVDSIRTFDCLSQRSLQAVKRADLSPACEVLISKENWEDAAQRMREASAQLTQEANQPNPLFADLPPLPLEEEDELPSLFETPAQEIPLLPKNRKSGLMAQDADLIGQGIPFRRIQAWVSVLTDETVTVLDWLEDAVVMIDQPDQLKERAHARHAGFLEELTAAMERGDAVSAQSGLLFTWEDIFKSTFGRSVVTMTEFLLGLGGFTPSNLIEIQAKGIAPYQSQMRNLAKDCRAWKEAGFATVLLAGGVSRGKRLQQSLNEMEAPCLFVDEMQHNLVLSEIIILPDSLQKGFIWPQAKLCVVSDADIYGAGYRKAHKQTKTVGEKIAAFTDLAVGDYVVHEDHGVGIYQGTIRLQSEGTYRDYLFIQYQGNDKLYVPTEQFDRVQRFIGSQQAPPKINKLGGGEWQRQKSKVKSGIKAMAFDLLKLYAQREAQKGHAFSQDTPWQRQFEDQFPYELTPDQLKSVVDITRDMETPRNMDRLLCGDVGYGKTEVALRAAFKAVTDNKQVAILAPTTILAQQHYNTIVRRFEGFPVRCEMVSRFKTAKEQKEIVSRCQHGDVDILVGTHRLLNKDVKFKDLGLLVVDEEQRFGVSHKEIIKNMKNTVDVLTLSATPIPRTLHMSMVGIRDMSLLETPPEERFPVQTYVTEYADATVRDAILREISRGGQVYFLYNRVRSIESFYARLKALVPEARIGVAHGQMREHALEDVMMDFYAGSYDVLLCTTIIESGLDVPTANTLIVFDADRFGLSQLYQLRGRVGRSNRQAYAYFTVRPDKMLSEAAQKRLSAIREFTEFGAGFRIAMRDLEIRGAGNILGPEQHGHLSTVGYDMYCKLMEQTLREVKGEIKESRELDTRVELKMDAYLPGNYVKDDRQRMEMYRRIATIDSQSVREDIEEEMLDRFGEAPVVVSNLMDIAHLRGLANKLGISQVTYRGGCLRMRFDDKYAPDPIMLVDAMMKADRRLSLLAGKPPCLVFKDNAQDQAQMPSAAVKALEKMVDDISMAQASSCDAAQ